MQCASTITIGKCSSYKYYYRRAVRPIFYTNHTKSEFALCHIYMDLCKLPLDVQKLIFDDVTRTIACSVSSTWCALMISISMSKSPVPELYAIKSDDEYVSLTCVPKSTILLIFQDYHLTMRLIDYMREYTREMCIAGNRDVFTKFIAMRVYIPNRDLIFCKPDLRSLGNYSTPFADYDLIVYLILNNFEHLLPEITYQAYPTGTQVKPVVNAIIELKSLSVLDWAMKTNWLPWKLLPKLSKRADTHYDMLAAAIPLMKYQRHMIFKKISIDATFRLIADGVVTINQALEGAFYNDNLEMFDKLVSAGANTDTVDFYDGASKGIQRCLMRVVPANVDTRRLIMYVSSNADFEFISANFDIPTTDYNYLLIECVEEGNNIAGIVAAHANNYDAELYKKYGIVKITH